MDIAVRELVKATAAHGGALPSEFEQSAAERAVVVEAQKLELITSAGEQRSGGKGPVLTEKGWDAASKYLAETPDALRAHLASRARPI